MLSSKVYPDLLTALKKILFSHYVCGTDQGQFDIQKSCIGGGHIGGGILFSLKNEVLFKRVKKLPDFSQVP